MSRALKKYIFDIHIPANPHCLPIYDFRILPVILHTSLLSISCFLEPFWPLEICKYKKSVVGYLNRTPTTLIGGVSVFLAPMATVSA